MMPNEGLGKKVFFLFPHSVIKDDLITTLTANEYESYILKDHERAYRILREFPDSILFINIDEGLSEPEWEAFVTRIRGDPDLKEVRIGILSYNTDQELMRKYLMELSIPCGYIQLKLGIKESTKIILDALRANEAKGRRKFIRVSCAGDDGASLNYKTNNGIIHAKLLDLSSAGTAVMSKEFSAFQPKTLLKRVQLKLRASLVLVDAVHLGTRKDSPEISVLLFDPKTDEAAKMNIQRFIMQSLQRYIDSFVPSTE